MMPVNGRWDLIRRLKGLCVFDLKSFISLGLNNSNELNIEIECTLQF
jgi:hypothetical protein